MSELPTAPSLPTPIPRALEISLPVVCPQILVTISPRPPQQPPGGIQRTQLPIPQAAGVNPGLASLMVCFVSLYRNECKADGRLSSGTLPPAFDGDSKTGQEAGRSRISLSSHRHCSSSSSFLMHLAPGTSKAPPRHGSSPGCPWGARLCTCLSKAVWARGRR